MKKMILLLVTWSVLVLLSVSAFAMETKLVQIAYRPYAVNLADMQYATGFWGIIPPKSNKDTWWTWIQILPSDERVANDLDDLDKDRVYTCSVAGSDVLSSSKPPITITQIVYRLGGCRFN